MFNIVYALSPEELQEYLETAQQYGKFLADLYFHPVIFFVLVAILLSVYTIRFFMFLSRDKNTAKEKGIYKEYIVYILAHTFMQLLICFAVSYAMIKITYALTDSYIINWIISPIIGLFASIMADYLIVMRIEEKVGFFTNPLKEVKSIVTKKKDETSSNTSPTNTDNINNNITINFGKDIIDNQVVLESSEEKIKDETETIENKKEDVEMVSDVVRIQESQDDVIRTLIDVQEQQSKKIDELTQMVDALRFSLVTNLRFELNEMIKSCIAKGYATFDENDQIVDKMEVYSALKGNHGLQELYKNYYLKLPLK